jgi:hypothetical protein
MIGSRLIRLHILHRAVHESVGGQGMIGSWRFTGAGSETLYPMLHPMLHEMKRKSYLTSSLLGAGRRACRCIARRPRVAGFPALAGKRVRELLGELLEGR